MSKERAFTLIELLIVVAIIAILAAIAVPNFLEAQTRAKIARTAGDMRTISVGLESYFTDYSQYPRVNDGPWRPLSRRLRGITTPVAYIASIPRDPFPDLMNSAFGTPDEVYAIVDTFDYFDAKSNGGGLGTEFKGRWLWRLASAGPDLHQNWGREHPYDATNGTKSVGDIVLLNGGGNGWPVYFGLN